MSFYAPTCREANNAHSIEDTSIYVNRNIVKIKINNFYDKIPRSCETTQTFQKLFWFHHYGKLHVEKKTNRLKHL
jgi:hypothetical protein